MTTANLADQCAKVVMETVPQVMRAIREEMRRQGTEPLSLPQLRTLAYLHRNPGSCLFHLAKYLGVTRPTASTIVERLVRRRMLSRVDNPLERRRIVLTLTPLGARYLRRARQSTQRWMATALSRLSSARLRRIMQGVTLLGEPFAGAASDDGRE
ncbi:MAG TPA: MarR family winged helix-turn-helix transcriptional regulator [Candidatus Methylomirabilis sp.]|nr:MarR family winged helix-turn-helix transcriptional regulator [Candidatus Methylomirabilis sp.]